MLFSHLPKNNHNIYINIYIATFFLLAAAVLLSMALGKGLSTVVASFRLRLLGGKVASATLGQFAKQVHVIGVYVYIYIYINVCIQVYVCV